MEKEEDLRSDENNRRVGLLSDAKALEKGGRVVLVELRDS